MSFNIFSFCNLLFSLQAKQSMFIFMFFVRDSLHNFIHNFVRLKIDVSSLAGLLFVPLAQNCVRNDLIVFCSANKELIIRIIIHLGTNLVVTPTLILCYADSVNSKQNFEIS